MYWISALRANPTLPKPNQTKTNNNQTSSTSQVEWFQGNQPNQKTIKRVKEA
jgi:hypothetical protein